MNFEWIEKYMTEAESLIYNNQVSEGLALMNNLLYDEPGYGRLHNHIGWAYLYYTSEIASAELHFNMAIRFDETYPAPYLHMGNLYIRTGQYGMALEYLQKGISKPNANKVSLLENMGRTYELRGEYKKATGVYRQAIMASMANTEINALTEGIRRCRKKRLALFFSF